MNTFVVADPLPVSALGRRGVEEAGIPRKGNDNGTAIGQIEGEGVVRDGDFFAAGKMNFSQ